MEIDGEAPIVGQDIFFYDNSRSDASFPLKVLAVSIVQLAKKVKQQMNRLNSMNSMKSQEQPAQK